LDYLERHFYIKDTTKRHINIERKINEANEVL